MNLDGLFDRAQIAGNLLVEPARHDMRQTLRVRAGSGLLIFAWIDSSSE